MTEGDPQRGDSARTAAGAFAAAAVLVVAIQIVAGWSGGSQTVSRRAFDGLSQFDGPEYLSIAADGYQQRQLVWFPLYPTLIRLLGAVVGDLLLSGVVITLAAGLAAAVLYWRWMREHGSSTTGRRAGLLSLLLYPYAWFLYGTVYPNALFLALCLASFLLFERDRRWAATLVAAFATATRPAGFALVLGLLVLALERDGVLGCAPGARGWVADLRLPTSVNRSRLRLRVMWPLAGLAGLVAYGAYCWLRWGIPFGFMTEQANYHAPGPASLLKQQYFEAFSEGFDFRHLATTTFQAFILAAILMAVPAVGRRFGWGYATFTLGLALLPAISVSTFMGVGRYLLSAFPVFALLGEWLATRRRLRAIWLGTGGALMLLMAFGYSRSWYLS